MKCKLKTLRKLTKNLLQIKLRLCSTIEVAQSRSRTMQHLSWTRLPSAKLRNEGRRSVREKRNSEQSRKLKSRKKKSERKRKRENKKCQKIHDPRRRSSRSKGVAQI